MICRNCGAGLEAEGIDTSLGIVTCSHCGSLHDIPNDSPEVSPAGAKAGAGVSESAQAVKRERVEVALPSRFDVQRGPGSMQVSWSAGGIFPGLVLLIIAAGFAYASITSGMLFLLVGSAGIVYLAIARAFNTHRIRVDGARLQVTQGPIPWPGARKLNASDIEQLYATEHKTRIENDNDGGRKTRIRKHYRLSANTRNSGRVTILTGLGDPHQALWLEQEIERLLGIDDKRVAGEHV